jgi:hypothetical protein
MANRKQKQRRSKGGSTALAPSEFNGGSGCPLAAENEAGMSGGSGAADWATSVFGDTDNQHAAAGTNVIEMKNPEAGVVAQSDGVSGGRRGGRGVLTDVAVPALLLYANNTFKRRKSMRKSRKNRKSRRRRR